MESHVPSVMEKVSFQMTAFSAMAQKNVPCVEEPEKYK